MHAGTMRLQSVWTKCPVKTSFARTYGQNGWKLASARLLFPALVHTLCTAHRAILQSLNSPHLGRSWQYWNAR